MSNSDTVVGCVCVCVFTCVHTYVCMCVKLCTHNLSIAIQNYIPDARPNQVTFSYGKLWYVQPSHRITFAIISHHRLSGASSPTTANSSTMLPVENEERYHTSNQLDWPMNMHIYSSQQIRMHAAAWYTDSLPA